MPRSRPPAFAASAAALAVFAVHQARYALIPDPAAEGGHGYLIYATPLLASALAAGLGIALLRLTGTPEEADPRPAAPLPVRWAAASALLVFVYAAQELAEGHAADVVGHGAWLVPLLATAAGLLLALGLGHASVVLQAGARALRRYAVPVHVSLPAPLSWRPLAAPPVRRRSPVATFGAGRAPPLPVG
jgi:hypothetical protein